MTHLFPARFFGNLAYFKSLYQANKIVLEQHEHFYKQQAINRLSILSANGVLELTVPVSKPFGSKTPIHHVLLSHQEDWKKNHLKSLESAYTASPFFEYYYYDLKQFYKTTPENLLMLNCASIELVGQWLDLTFNFTMTTSHEYSGDFIDFRKESFLSVATRPVYQQVFNEKEKFVDHLSILDIVFNEGPMARKWITEANFPSQ